MAVSERDRRELQEVLVDKLGAKHADTLFAYLPQAGWGELATKADLQAVRGELLAAIASLGTSLMRWMFALWMSAILAFVGTLITVLVRS